MHTILTLHRDLRLSKNKYRERQYTSEACNYEMKPEFMLQFHTTTN